MPKPSHHCLAVASGWSAATAKLGRPTALCRSPTAGPGGHPTAAATRSRPAKVTGPPSAEGSDPAA
jgi:hypothetical protein